MEPQSALREAVKPVASPKSGGLISQPIATLGALLTSGLGGYTSSFDPAVGKRANITLGRNASSQLALEEWPCSSQALLPVGHSRWDGRVLEPPPPRTFRARSQWADRA